MQSGSQGTANSDTSASYGLSNTRQVPDHSKFITIAENIKNVV
jgi:hypothetical protein